MFFSDNFHFSRSPHETHKKAGPEERRPHAGGGEAAAYRILRRPIGTPEARIRRESLPDRAAAAAAERRAGPERGADQNLVPE